MEKYAMPAPQEVLLSGQRIVYYESAASGQPVVLLHGNSLSGRCFARQFAGEPGNKYRLIAMDLPGHGKSAPAANPAVDYTLPGYANVVAELVTHLGLKGTIFAGWSLGGHILLEAARLLDRAAGFMIFGTPPISNPMTGEPFKPNPLMHHLFENELRDCEAEVIAASFFSSDDQVPDLFAEEMIRTDGRARAALWQSVTEGAYADEVMFISNLDRPLAIFHGEDDQLVNLPYIQSLSIPDLWQQEVKIIPNAGHACHWEQPEQFNRLLDEFVETCSS